MSLQDSTPSRKQKPLVVTDRLRLQRVFARMKQSCYATAHPSYPNYGGRGIYICAEWLDAGSSEPFVEWALQHGYQHGLDINRIDNEGPYSPGNCNFVTRSENNLNQRQTLWVTHEGSRQRLRPLMATLLPNKTNGELMPYLRRVKKYGYSVEEAVAKPMFASPAERAYEKAFTYNGKHARLIDHLADAEFPTDLRTVKTCWARIAAGWPLSRVFTEPIANRSPQAA